MSRQIVTKGDLENPVPVEILERSIVEIAAAMKKVQSTRLTRDTLVTLIHRYTISVSRAQINNVLDNLAALETKCLSPLKK